MALEPTLEPSDYQFAHRLRTRFAETDAMGVIHHAAYLPYLEQARVELLRHAGRPYQEVRAQGLDFVVLESYVRYRRPLRFDDEVVVHLRAGAFTATTFQFGYLLEVEGEPRATAVTVHGVVDGTGRPRRLPSWLAGAL